MSKYFALKLKICIYSASGNGACRELFGLFKSNGMLTVFQIIIKMFMLTITIFFSMCTVNAKSTLTQLNRASGTLKSIPKQGTERDITAGIDSRCLDCICQKETHCNHNQQCNNDGSGEACGAYQIPQLYFQECCRFLDMSNCDSDSAWRTCSLDYNCATRCVTVN